MNDGKWEPITRIDCVYIAAVSIAALAPWIGLGIFVGWWIWA